MLKALQTRRPKRRCYSCKRSKSLSCFMSDSSRPYGKSYQCKLCKRDEARKRSRKNSTTYKSNYYRQNIIKYGLSVEQYEQLLATQSGCCAICCRPETAFACKKYSTKPRRLSIDHNHETGKVRGLLCSKCNGAIGMLYENDITLHNARAYLEQHG